MRLALAFAAVLLSGFAALADELVWIRRASLAFGSTTLAVSTVVAVFFLGLALGSEVFGRFSRRLARPLRAFALVEVGIALVAVASPALFDVAESVYGRAYRAAGERPALLVAARAALVALVLLPPAFLMGGALPLACRAVARSARTVGALYGVNTLGAAAGCALAGLALLPALGEAGALRVAAAANVVAALVAWAIAAPVVPADDAPRPAAARGPVVLLFFLVGAVALGLEVLWTRFLALVVPNTVHTFTLTLAVVLVGIVVGSLLAAALVDRVRDRALAFGLLAVGVGLSVLALMTRAPSFWHGLDGALAAYGLLLLPPSVLSGATFPLAVRLVGDAPGETGFVAGRLLAANVLGGIVGSLAVGFLVLPALGLHAGVLIVAAVAVGTGLAAARRPPLALVATLAFVAIPALSATRLPHDFLADPDETLVAVHEGYGGNLAVLARDGERTLEIDRWWQGTDGGTHQVLAAHVPLLLHDDPRRVLVVGVGAGRTPAAVLEHDVEHVDVVDVEPAVFDVVAAHFDAAWMGDPRVRLLRRDGRDHVAHADATYDAVLLELGQVARPGVASFYTAEFYARARERLAPGGVLCQLVQLPFFTPDELRRVVASALAVFPTSVLWSNTAELLLVGVNGDAVPTPRLDALDDLDLAFAHWGGPAEHLSRPGVFLAGFLMGPDGLAALAGDAAPYTDDRPDLAYAAAAVDTLTATRELETVPLLRAHLEEARAVLRTAVEPDERVRDRNLDDIVARALLRVARGDLAVLQRALLANPEDVEVRRALGAALVAHGRVGEAEAHFAAAVRIDPADGRAQRDLAFARHRLGHVDEALAAYRAAVALRPDDAEVRNNYGAALAQSGDLAAALEQFEAAVALRPGWRDAEENLAQARAALR